ASPIFLFADPVRLEQILGNLINNAVKFTPQGGHIWVTATEGGDGGDGGDGNGVSVSIRDDGDGIAADAIGRVFDLFMQGNTSLDRAQGGLGIGLTLVRGLVELHGGTIDAKSDGAGRGSEFIVRLPVQDGPAHAEPRRPWATSTTLRACWTPRRSGTWTQ